MNNVQVGIRTKHPLATDHVPINYSRASVEAGGRARIAHTISPHQLARSAQYSTVQYSTVQNSTSHTCMHACMQAYMFTHVRTYVHTCIQVSIIPY